MVVGYLYIVNSYSFGKFSIKYAKFVAKYIVQNLEKNNSHILSSKLTVMLEKMTTQTTCGHSLI